MKDKDSQREAEHLTEDRADGGDEIVRGEESRRGKNGRREDGEN